jgi:hypothetical protein
MLSLFSCFCAAGAAPVILALDASTTLTAKLSIAGTLGGFGLFTTGLLHWFASPYVHRLAYRAQDDSVEVTTLSLFANPKRRRFAVADAAPPATVHPLSTFAIPGGKYYYVDLDHFENKELAARLAQEPAHAAPEQPGEEGASAAVEGASPAAEGAAERAAAAEGAPPKA